MQIYWGAVPYVCIQVIMVGLIIAFPGIVSSGLDKKEVIDLDKVVLEVQVETPTPTLSAPVASDGTPAPADDKAAEDDPMKAMQQSMEKDKK